jgi:hypothetical protein
VERPLEVDHRADIYSLGVVFYELLTGQLPVGRFPLPSERAGTDAFLDEVVLRALEREPERRYQHASDVKTDVEAPARQATALTPGTGAGDAELARHQLRGPATALTVMGVLGPLGWLVVLLIYALFLYVDTRGYMPQFWFDLRRAYTPFVVLGLLNAVVGGFLIAGARLMKRLEAYELSVLTSLSVVLQILTPTFPISFIVGGWAFWVLRKPEIKAAFAHQVRRRARGPAGTGPPPARPAGPPGHMAPRSPLRQFFFSLTPWAVLCCLVGLVECSLAGWIDVYAEGVAPQGLSAAEAGWSSIAPKNPEVRAVSGRFRITGGETWQGGTAAALCLMLAVWLIATSALDPIPAWRPLIWVAAALAVLCTSALFLLRFESERLALGPKFAATYPRLTISNIVAVPQNGPYVACLAGLALLVLATVQLYRALRAEPRPVSRRVEYAGRPE